MDSYISTQQYIKEMEEMGIPFDCLCIVDLHVLGDDECFYCHRADCPLHPE